MFVYNTLGLHSEQEMAKNVNKMRPDRYFYDRFELCRRQMVRKTPLRYIL